MTNNKLFLNLRVLLFQEDNVGIAQCLEKNIVAQGASLSGAVEALEHVLIKQILLDMDANKTPLKDVEDAPLMYVSMYRESKPYRAITPLELPKELLSKVRGITTEFRVHLASC